MYIDDSYLSIKKHKRTASISLIYLCTQQVDLLLSFFFDTLDILLIYIYIQLSISLIDRLDDHFTITFVK
jgi:hypothetical protein